MPLKDILVSVAADVGLPNYTEDDAVRAHLIEKVNKAAKEIYERTDVSGCLRELFVKVTPNKVIALPQFVGELRAIRQRSIERPWTLNDLRPRYHVYSWESQWRSWRFIGYAAIQTDIVNAAPVYINIPVADSTLTVTIVGATIDSNRVIDTITLSATSNTSTKNFTSIDSIQLNKVADYDITILDAEDNELAVIPNNVLESRYALYDVSAYPSGGDCSDGTNLMEVLYKMRLPWLSEDNDVFPVPDHDDIIAEKTVQLYVEKQEGKEDRAVLLDQKIERALARKMQDKEGVNVKKMKFVENPLLGMFRGRKYYSSRRFGSRYY